MLTYTEFDTTAQDLVVALRNAILASTDWTRLTSSSVLLTSTANSNAGATTLTFASGAPAAAGVGVGSIIAIDAEGPLREWRAVTAVSATTVTVAALTYTHPSGTNIYPGNEVLSCTTSRGAKMVVDLTDGAPVVNGLQMAVWNDHTGAVGTNRLARFLYWRANTTGAALSNPLHCVVSASKEHLFISVEGARPGEAGAVSATLGSYRNYFFMDDVVPYHSGDTTPVIFAGGANISGAGSATAANQSHLGHLSKNYEATQSWNPSKLGSVEFPTVSSSVLVGLQRQTVAGGEYYLFPYLVCSDADGVRGRLSNFFFAGYTLSASQDTVGVPSIGAKVTREGQTYKLLAVDKGIQSGDSWGQFGAASNGTSMTNSVVVAVPCTP